MLNNKDLMFIGCLRDNARETLTKISKKTKIPISTLYDRLKMHEKTFITKHTTLIDFAKLGFATKASVMIKSSRETREKLQKHLQVRNEVNSLYKINNGYDFLIEVITKHVKDLEDFLDELEEKFNVTDKQVFYIIEDIKRENFLSALNVSF